jgi:type IV pilus assembly protein PilV
MNATKRKYAPAARGAIAGISMVESLVALVVISVGMLGIAGLYLASLQGNRTARVETEANYLVADMIDRIRANRNARGAYDVDTYGGAPGVRGCVGGRCTSAELAEDDLARWIVAVQGALPGAAAVAPQVQFTDNATPNPDRYTVTIGWRAAGDGVDRVYSVSMEQ